MEARNIFEKGALRAFVGYQQNPANLVSVRKKLELFLRLKQGVELTEKYLLKIVNRLGYALSEREKRQLVSEML